MATIEEFVAARFGMFIHWGAYSVPARGEWIMERERVPKDVYGRWVDEFKAEGFDAASWAELAKSAGMKYLVFTTKHHDGFAMWDSQVSAFTSMKRGPRRDFVREITEACRSAGVYVGLYFSLKDWSHPDYLALQRGDEPGHERFIEYVHSQVRELLTGYGPVDILWFDGPSPYDYSQWRTESLLAEARGLQPGLLVNNRARNEGDFATPEQTLHGAPADKPWEACMTLNAHWAYHAGDRALKSAGQAVRLLAGTVARGGNLLLNVGPTSQGLIPQEHQQVLRQVGQWTHACEEAIYGTRPAATYWAPFGYLAAKGNTIYALVLDDVGDELVLAGYDGELGRVRALASGRDLRFRQEEGLRVVVQTGGESGTKPPCAIAFDFEEVPRFVPWGRGEEG